MKDKLVTLAIRTYQRAQVLKTLLANHGIPAEIHNLNLENPEMAVGVRVRIKESDLPKALKILETVEKEWEKSVLKPVKKSVLIPIDLADMVEKTIEVGFDIAHRIQAEVEFLYVYHIPTYTISNVNEINTYAIPNNELIRRIVGLAEADSKNLDKLIQNKIFKQEIPSIPYKITIKQGVPEEIVPDYCKKHKPDLIVVGTHGRKNNNELLGSVAAEVIEIIESPVMAIPQQSANATVERIAFLTNFDEKDLIAIDRTIELFLGSLTEILFIHATDKKNKWDEIMLAGIKTYFANNYPTLKTNYSFLSESTESIDAFIVKNSIDLIALNTRKRRLFPRIFNPGIAYKLLEQSNTMLFVMHV